VARAADDDAVGKLWLCHHDWHQVAAWRALSDEVKLVDSTRLRRIKEGPERRAAELANAGVDAINMHASDWSAGLTTLFHRFERLAFAWDAQFERVLSSLIAMGCDAIYSDHVERMVDALQEAERG
jgi:glycerophosphoryl diester phosphodiesterase